MAGNPDKCNDCKLLKVKDLQRNKSEFGNFLPYLAGREPKINCNSYSLCFQQLAKVDPGTWRRRTRTPAVGREDVVGVLHTTDIWLCDVTECIKTDYTRLILYTMHKD